MAPKETAKETAQDSHGSEDENFKYIVRIANTDLDGEKSLGLALTSIKGIGRRTALSIIRATGLNPRMKVGHLTDEQEEMLKKEISSLSSYLPVRFLNRRRAYETGHGRQDRQGRRR